MAASPSTSLWVMWVGVQAPRLERTTPLERCPHCGVEAKRLARHLRLCPKLAELEETQRLPFYRSGVSAGAQEVRTTSKGVTLATDELVQRVLRAQKHVYVRPCATEFEGPLMADSVRGAERTRQQRQNLGLSELLKEAGVLGNGALHVELGAGNAGLSLSLAKASGARDAHVLLDQYAPRRKDDKHLRDLGVEHHRFKIDIRDLDLGALQRHYGSRHITVASKHLCGCATDFGLRCLRTLPSPCEAVLIATCCHHRCDWQSYVNPLFFEKLGFSRREFEAIARLSSWAVDGGQGERSARRQAVGQACKRLLDAGRIEYLRGLGYASDACEYISSEFTPENVALFAWRPHR